ncbi:MAG: tetratricopeptide repeat protein [Lysobacter sp.]|nr:tetratricopeptide repeat protein [Lysobacter sp.]
MTPFVPVAIALTLAVFAFVLKPLWPHSRGLFAAIALTLAVTTFALYRVVGTPAALDPKVVAGPETLGDAITQLEAKLQTDPGQAEGWRLLGRAYVAEQRFADAREAYTRAAKLAPNDAETQVEAAESRALANPQRRFDAQAVSMLQRALLLQPQQQRGRWFLGIAQRQAGNHAEAAATWQPLLAQVDAKTAASLRPQIDAARRDAGLPPLPEAEATATSANALTVKVTLDPDFASRVRLDGSASIFVIARMPGGAPMPVAVEKRSVQELPFTVTLDDSDGPMPTQKLSALQDVEVIARLSASGNAMRQEGDIESRAVRVTLPVTEPVELTIGAAR